MHNWRLLLLAFLAVFQPIVSFTERSLVHGRQECSEHRGLWDSRLSIYGTHRHAKPAEERRVNYRENREARDSRRYEVKDENSELATSERRVVDFRAREEVRESPERSARYARDQYRARDSRNGFDNRLTRLSTTDDWRNSLRDTDRRHRSREVSPERSVRDSRHTRQNERQQREPSYDILSPVERTARIDNQRSRFSIDARRDSRRHGDFLRESRIAVHPSRVEVARMEPTRHREETRVTMERARQVDREVGSRRDARLQHRERSLGRLTRDESQRRSSTLDTRSNNGRVRYMRDSGNEINNLMGEENRHTSGRITVDHRDSHRETRDDRVSRDERSFTRREARDSTKRSTELPSRDLSRSRILQARASELRRSRDVSGIPRVRVLESRLTERSIQLRSKDIARSRRSAARSSELESSRDLGDSERRTPDRSIGLRSRDFARSRSLETRSSDLRRSRDIDRSSNERSELERSRDIARSRPLEATSSGMEKRSNERLSKLMRSIDFDKRSAERSTELRRARDAARSRSLEPKSFRTERASAERRDTRRSLEREAVVERRDTRRSYVQNREEGRSSELTRESRRVTGLRTLDRSTRLESQRNEADLRSRDHEDKRTVSEIRRVESRRITDKEWTRNREITLREFRTNESNRRSTEPRTRRSAEARNIKNVLERDTIVSRSRANDEARRNRDAWSFAHEKPQIEAQNVTVNWHYLLYTVQAIYLASFLVKMLGENGASEKKIRCHGFAAAKKLLKLE